MSRRVINILMERDGITENDARDLINNVREEIHEAIADGDYDLAEDIMMYDLGLEPDYVFDIL